jgi:hypothetical protein
LKTRRLKSVECTKRDLNPRLPHCEAENKVSALPWRVRVLPGSLNGARELLSVGFTMLDQEKENCQTD